MVRVGLVVVALTLVCMVLAGVGMGLGLIQIDSHGLSLVHKDESVDPNTGQPDRVVSADDLLRQKGVTYSAPVPANESPSSAAPAAVAQNTPAPSPQTVKPAPQLAKNTQPTATQTPGVTPAVAPKPVLPAAHDEKPAVAVNVETKPGTIRIAAGSPVSVRDPHGNIWEADTGFDEGGIVNRGPIDIANTDFPELYRTEHFAAKGWHKSVPNGKYVVNLYFAETSEHVNDEHPRVFHMVVQGQQLRDLNVAKEAGGRFRAMVKSFHVAVTDEKLSILFSKVSDDAEELNGIEIIPDELPAIRVDAGSNKPIRDAQGNMWVADSDFDGGSTVDRGPIAIANTDFPDLYRTERYDMKGWHKQVANGKYTVKLHFAETWDGINDGHPRIFSVNVQGNTLRELNVAKETGGLRRALVKTFHVTVTDGKLWVNFERVGDNVPEINGIEVTPER